jgi:hypothetical protein
LYKFLKQNENEMEYYLSHPDRNVRLTLTKFRQWPVTKNRTYGKIAGFWVITQKPLIISEI